MSVFIDDGDRNLTSGLRERSTTGAARGGSSNSAWHSRSILRFYALSPLERTDTEPGSPRMSRMVFSVGVSIQ